MSTALKLHHEINFELVNETTGDRFPLNQGQISIGRGKRNDIALESAKASRNHATIMFEGDEIYIVDNNSSNGIKLNGIKIKPDTPTLIKARDIFVIGDFEFKIHSDQHVPKQPKPRRAQLVPEEERVSSIMHDTSEDVSQYPPAVLWQRWASLIIDGVLYATVLSIITALTEGQLDKKMISSAANSAYGFYEIFYLMTKGQTIGCKLLKVKVVSLKDDKLNFFTVFIRQFLRNLSIVFFPITLLMYMFNKENRFLHDIATGTKVIKTKE